MSRDSFVSSFAATEPRRHTSQVSLGNDQKEGYRSHYHFLALHLEKNICAPDSSALGEPIVVSTSRSKCDKFRTALAVCRQMDNGSEREAANVFVRRSAYEWVYRGVYELAFDGSDEYALRLAPVR